MRTCEGVPDAEERTTTPRDHVLLTSPRFDSDRALVEQAKGALMLRFGVGPHDAFALLLTWSRDMHTTLHTLTHTLVNGACQGSEGDQYDPALVSWLREQLSEDFSSPSLW